MENDYIMIEVEPNKYKKIKTAQITADDISGPVLSMWEAPFGKGLIEVLNKAEEKFEMKRGERGQTNMKIYKIKVFFINDKEKVEIVSAESELEAIDLVFEKYKSKNKDEEIVDMRIF